MSVTGPKANKTAPSGRPARAARPVDQVADALDALCTALGPGGRIPPHIELMRRFDASERAVREALEALRRSGRIVSRRGSGTFVAEESDASDTSPAYPPIPADARTVIAVAPTDHSFFERSLDLFCRLAEAADLSPICKPVSNLDSNSLTALARSLSESPAGNYLLFGYPLEPVACHLYESGARRIILFGTPPADMTTPPDYPLIYGDQEYGGYLITSHLIALGHRRLAFVYFDGEERLANNRRWRGHRRAIEEARRRGVSIEDIVLSQEAQAWQTDPQRAAVYLRAPDAPTALVCWNDHTATALLPALHRAGVKVPEEVSIAGYDDLPESRLSYPLLTTVDPAASQILRIAIDMLNRSDPPAPGFTVTVPTLVARESTGAPPTQSG